LTGQVHITDLDVIAKRGMREQQDNNYQQMREFNFVMVDIRKYKRLHSKEF
jgi:hypothetical protein